MAAFSRSKARSAAVTVVVGVGVGRMGFVDTGGIVVDDCVGVGRWMCVIVVVFGVDVDIDIVCMFVP
jgi:hypothetical protein